MFRASTFFEHELCLVFSLILERMLVSTWNRCLMNFLFAHSPCKALFMVGSLHDFTHRKMIWDIFDFWLCSSSFSGPIVASMLDGFQHWFWFHLGTHLDFNSMWSVIVFLINVWIDFVYILIKNGFSNHWSWTQFSFPFSQAIRFITVYLNK